MLCRTATPTGSSTAMKRRHARAAYTPGETIVRVGKVPHAGIARALDFILHHFTEPINLDDVARAAYMSRYHLSRTFHRVVGVSFRTYLTGLRVEHARQLVLATPHHSLTRIAAEGGLGGLRNLEMRFQQFFGCTPSAYRAGSRPGKRHWSSKRPRRAVETHPAHSLT